MHACTHARLYEMHACTHTNACIHASTHPTHTWVRIDLPSLSYIAFFEQNKHDVNKKKFWGTVILQIQREMSDINILLIYHVTSSAAKNLTFAS